MDANSVYYENNYLCIEKDFSTHLINKSNITNVDFKKSNFFKDLLPYFTLIAAVFFSITLFLFSFSELLMKNILFEFLWEKRIDILGIGLFALLFLALFNVGNLVLNVFFKDSSWIYYNMTITTISQKKIEIAYINKELRASLLMMMKVEG